MQTQVNSVWGRRHLGPTIPIIPKVTYIPFKFVSSSFCLNFWKHFFFYNYLFILGCVRVRMYVCVCMCVTLVDVRG